MTTDNLTAPVVSEAMRELVDELWNEIVGYCHAIGADGKRQLRQNAERTRLSLLRAIETLKQDKHRLDLLDLLAKRNGVIITAGDNSFSVVTSSVRMSIDDFIAECSPSDSTGDAT